MQTPEVKAAIAQQHAIGFHMMVRGFLATGWYDAIAATGASHPERKMTALQGLVWDTIVDPLWATRNDILHRQQNNFDAVEQERMAERMIWYSQHREEILSSHDQFLAEFDVATISRMPKAIKRVWVRHLDSVRHAFEIERRQRASNQHVITRYLARVNPSLSQHNQGPGPASA